jgi:glycosyltransferase involved in cell wall biosynthesis
VARQLEQADAIVTISDYNREHILRLSETLSTRTVDVVHCGVDPVAFAPAGPPPGQLRILSVGRAVEKKGHEYLIAACAQLRGDGRDFRCQIVTGGVEGSSHLSELVENLDLGGIVELVGSRGEEELIRLYQSSHVFALASVVARNGDRDGIPVSLMEAMACGLPVVSTTVSGIGELVTDGTSGLLVEPRNVEALTAALRRMVDDPHLRTQLGREGRRVVERSFNARASAERMASLFRSLVGRQSTA